MFAGGWFINWLVCFIEIFFLTLFLLIIIVYDLGVIDDRGKFIYISQSELNAVASFIKKRGRVSLTELAEHSNNLIVLDKPILTT